MNSLKKTNGMTVINMTPCEQAIRCGDQRCAQIYYLKGI
jgi:hypothetical protein